MDVESRLEEIVNLVNFRLYHLADKKIDNLYEDYTQDKIKMTKDQEDQMFYLIDTISIKLYG